jgi:hypothetical protein
MFASPSKFFDPMAIKDPAPDATVRLGEDIAIRPGALLGSSPWPIHAPADYWRDPVKNGDRFLKDISFFDCGRFYSRSDSDCRSVPFFDRVDRGTELFERMSAEPAPFGQLDGSLSLPQQKLLRLLVRYGLAHAK